jgi:hypothetical protein
MTYEELHSLLSSHGINCGFEKSIGKDSWKPQTDGLFIEDNPIILNRLIERIGSILNHNSIEYSLNVLPNEDMLQIKLK